MQKIGPCKFSELPQHYRDLFEAGTLHSVAGQFFPCEPSSIAVPVATFLSLAYILPALGIICAGPYYIYQDPTLILHIINDMTSSVFQFLVIVILFLVIVWGVFFMLNMGVRSLANVMVWIKTKRAVVVGKHHYGLLLDEQNLILRHGEHFADNTCAFVPKSAITDCFVSKVRVEGAKRYFSINVVKLHYVDEQKQSNELDLKEQFLMSAPEMHHQIQQWIQVLYCVVTETA